MVKNCAIVADLPNTFSFNVSVRTVSIVGCNKEQIQLFQSLYCSQQQLPLKPKILSQYGHFSLCGMTLLFGSGLGVPPKLLVEFLRLILHGINCRSADVDGWDLRLVSLAFRWSWKQTKMVEWVINLVVCLTVSSRYISDSGTENFCFLVSIECSFVKRKRIEDAFENKFGEMKTTWDLRTLSKLKINLYSVGERRSTSTRCAVQCNWEFSHSSNFNLTNAVEFTLQHVDKAQH